jgi:hypothetical protein
MVMRYTCSEACSFIESRSVELARVADEAKLDTLAYLLRMVHLEAQRLRSPETVPHEDVA